MSDLVAAAEYNRRSVTPGSAQGNDGSFATPTGGGRNSVSPHPQAGTPPPNLNRPLLKINIPNRGPTTGQMVSFCLYKSLLVFLSGVIIQLCTCT